MFHFHRKPKTIYQQCSPAIRILHEHPSYFVGIYDFNGNAVNIQNAQVRLGQQYQLLMADGSTVVTAPITDWQVYPCTKVIDANDTEYYG